jgi:hypothetical protein
MTAQQQVIERALDEIQVEALNTAWSRYSLPATVVSGTVGLAGTLAMSALLPGLGPWVAIAAAVAIAGGGVYVPYREGEEIEAGNMEAVARYLTPERLAKILKPYTDELSAKKLSPQQRGQTPTQPATAVEASPSTTTTPPPENGGNVSLDDLMQTAIASSVLLASLRGTGKTSLLQELFSHAMPGYLLVLDPKNSNSLGVLEPYACYLPPNGEGSYLCAVVSVRDELRRRNKEKLRTEDCIPLWLVIDEYQTTRTNWSQLTQDAVKNALSEIINQGRERRVFVVLMGQSPLCGDIGFSGGERDNMAILALGCAPQTGEQGGGGGWGSTDRLVQSSHIIPNKQTRDRLSDAYKQLKSSAGATRRVLASPSGLCMVPDLSKKRYGALPHQPWVVNAAPEQAVSDTGSEAARWRVPMLVEDLVSNALLPIRPVDLGKRYWAQRIQKDGLITSRDATTMQGVIDTLCAIYEPFYSDGDGRLSLAE